MQKGSDTCKPWSWPFPGHLRDEPTVATSPGKGSLRPHKQSSVCMGQTWIWRRPESTPWEVSERVQLHKCVTWHSQSGLTFPSLIMIIRGNKEVCGRRHWVCGAGHGTTLRPEAQSQALGAMWLPGSAVTGCWWLPGVSQGGGLGSKVLQQPAAQGRATEDAAVLHQVIPVMRSDLWLPSDKTEIYTCFLLWAQNEARWLNPALLSA